LEPGATVRDFVRHAIIKTSSSIEVSTRFAHTGWREVDGKMVFLHSDGAVGSPGGISVQLSKELQQYCLPPLTPDTPESASPVKSGLKAALNFLNIADRSISIPLFSSVFLAPLTTLLSPMPNFSFFLQGLSGSKKSTLAILALSFFGKFNSVQSLSNFSDTISILEKRSFTLKDVLHCVDDFHPSANKRTSEAMENSAQSLIRSYSNRTARGRLNSDMSERGRYEPRGILIMTSEHLISIESTLARVCNINVDEGLINLEKLTEVQGEAEFLPYCMAAYISWIAGNMAAITGTFPDRFRELRRMATNAGFHSKLCEQTAFMTFALEAATSFFHDKKMLTDSEAKDLTAEAWEIFKELATNQQRRIEDDNPVNQFFEILGTLLHQHNVKLDPLPSCGMSSVGADERIGFFDETTLYLIPSASWHAVNTFCLKEGSHFSLGKTTFFQMLQSKKIIQPSSKGESTQIVKIAGKSFRILKVINQGIFQKLVETIP